MVPLIPVGSSSSCSARERQKATATPSRHTRRFRCRPMRATIGSRRPMTRSACSIRERCCAFGSTTSSLTRRPSRNSVCISGALERGNVFPVEFDAGGTAFFQYEVHDDFHANAIMGGRCHAGGAVHPRRARRTARHQRADRHRLPRPPACARHYPSDAELRARRRPDRHRLRDRLPGRGPRAGGVVRRALGDRLPTLRRARSDRAARGRCQRLGDDRARRRGGAGGC